MLSPEQMGAVSDMTADEVRQILARLVARGFIVGNEIEGYVRTTAGDLALALAEEAA